MSSLVLKTATRLLITLLLLYSIFLLLRGHNSPGGGFVGGLVASSAWILYSLAQGPRIARAALGPDPRHTLGAGLLAMIASGLLGVLSGKGYLGGEWLVLQLTEIRKVEVGTPLLFDLGVYLVVLGTTLTAILALEEED